ncbi:MAG: sigma-70 family RNA polymerase sigma factor [Spirosomataceae bacterium]
MFLKILRKPKPQTDAEYVQAYRTSGNMALLGELYERNMELVFAVCYKYLRDEEEAKDAVMQVFEELIGKLRTHEVSNFKSWLHSVARNYCLMQLRSRKVRVSEDEFLDEEAMEIQPALHLIDDDVDLESNLSQLEDCLSTLVMEQRTSVELFFMKEKSYKEIVEVTGYELNKVKSYIQNGKRNLKICMEKER